MCKKLNTSERKKDLYAGPGFHTCQDAEMAVVNLVMIWKLGERNSGDEPW